MDIRGAGPAHAAGSPLLDRTSLLGPVVDEPVQGERLIPKFNQYMTGVYYVPSLTAECSVRYNLEGSSPARGKRQSW